MFVLYHHPAASQRWHPTGMPSPRPVHISCVYTIFTLAIISEKQRKAGGYSPAQDWARARRGGGGASLGAAFEGADVLRAGARFVRFLVGVAAASWSTLKARRRRRKDSRRSSQMGLCGASRPRVVSDDELSVEFSNIDQPSTTGPSSSSLSTTVKGEEMCWRESWGRCILFQRGRRSGRVGKKIPGAPGFFPLAVRASGLLPEGAEAAAAAARLHGTRFGSCGAGDYWSLIRDTSVQRDRCLAVGQSQRI